jgi:hypothetical protein
MLGDHDPNYAGKLLGFVRVDVGGQSFTLPVQALHYSGSSPHEGPHRGGGFFADSRGELGIFVDADGSEEEVREQIQTGCDEAVRHLSRRILN